jgi:hypothetical protein
MPRPHSLPTVMVACLTCAPCAVLCCCAVLMPLRDPSLHFTPRQASGHRARHTASGPQRRLRRPLPPHRGPRFDAYGPGVLHRGGVAGPDGSAACVNNPASMPAPARTDPGWPSTTGAHRVAPCVAWYARSVRQRAGGDRGIQAVEVGAGGADQGRASHRQEHAARAASGVPSPAAVMATPFLGRFWEGGAAASDGDDDDDDDGDGRVVQECGVGDWLACWQWRWQSVSCPSTHGHSLASPAAPAVGGGGVGACATARNAYNTGCLVCVHCRRRLAHDPAPHVSCPA